MASALLLALVVGVSGLLWWVMETTPVAPHGLDSFDVPPPIACSCPGRLLSAQLVDGAPHVRPCAFARAAVMDEEEDVP